MIRYVLAGFIVFVWTPAAFADEVRPVGTPKSDLSAFELCDSCVREGDFVGYAKFKATDVPGRHTIMIGNTETGVVYKLTYDVVECSTEVWNCNILIDSVELQNEATQQDFLRVVRAFRD